MKFLLIVPLLAGVIFFVTAVTEPDRLDEAEKRERLLTQFGINYKSMMTACSQDDLDLDDLNSCLDAFDEVKEFCKLENATQCGDKQMADLEKKLSDL